MLWLTLSVGALLLAAGSTADEDRVAGSVQFATHLYTTVRAAASDPTANVVISPLSVQTALGLLLMGAGGSTAQQIIEGLRFSAGNQSTVAAYFEESLGRYEQCEALKVANKIYCATGLHIAPEFSKIATNQFNSEAETVNFGDAQNAADTMNSWVENRTNHKIKEIFTPQQLDPSTRMVVANAVHFKAPWEHKFKPEKTIKVPFHGIGREKWVPTMEGWMSIKFGNVRELDAKMGLLPYAGTDLSMLIILPRETYGLDELEEKLKTYNFLERAMGIPMNQYRVRVRLPRFTIESTVDLSAVLTKMGMGQMFSAGADFSKLFVEPDALSVGSAVHKAFIDVNEEGTEAAAITGFPIMRVSTGDYLNCNHPFFYAIVSPQDVLFVGSVRTL